MTKATTETGPAAFASNIARSNVVTVEGLVKNIGRIRVIDDVDLTVRRGETHVVLGSAGSGKTTLVNTLVGALHPDDGRVAVFGVDPTRAAAAWHRRVASVSGEPPVWANLTGDDLIAHTTQIHGGIDRIVRDELLDMFGIDPTRHCRNYTPGERRKVAVTAALASAAELIILDEPTAGLDPQIRRDFIDWLRAHRSAHRAMLLTGTDLCDAEAVADRVSVFDHGRCPICATVPDLRQLTRTTITAEVDTPDSALAELTCVHDYTIRENAVRCDVDTHAVSDVIRRLLDCGLRHLDATAPTLDQLVRTLTATHAWPTRTCC